MERDGAELKGVAGHRLVRPREGVGGLRGLAHAPVADNVISNRVKSPHGKGRNGRQDRRRRRWQHLSPELVEGFARHERLPIDELVLLDIESPERLEIVGGLARRMLDRLGWGGYRLVLTGDRDAAIDGADFVLIQLRVGGQSARLTRTERSRPASASSARRRPVPAGWPRRYGPFRSCSSWPS